MKKVPKIGKIPHGKIMIRTQHAHLIAKLIHPFRIRPARAGLQGKEFAAS